MPKTPQRQTKQIEEEVEGRFSPTHTQTEEPLTEMEAALYDIRRELTHGINAERSGRHKIAVAKARIAQIYLNALLEEG